jgi:hypothetical protein
LRYSRTQLAQPHYLRYSRAFPPPLRLARAAQLAQPHYSHYLHYLRTQLAPPRTLLAQPRCSRAQLALPHYLHYVLHDLHY